MLWFDNHILICDSELNPKVHKSKRKSQTKNFQNSVRIIATMISVLKIRFLNTSYWKQRFDKRFT